MSLRIGLLTGAVALSGLSLSCVKTTTTRSAAVPPVATVAPFERQIRNAHDAGDGDIRLAQLRARVAAEPDNVGARLELASAYRERGYPEVALELTRLTAGRFPDSSEAELALVTDLHSLKQRPEAIASLQSFLQHPRKEAALYSWLGIVLDESGQWSDGEPQHRKAVELAPANDSLRNNLGYNLLMQKRYADAAGEFQQALKLNPNSEIARNNLGMAQAAQESSKLAVASFQTGTDAATAHNNLAAVLMEKGNYAEARKELNIALGYNRSHAAALRNLELLSRLDGHDATMPKPSAQTRWQRFKAGFARLFATKPDAKPDPSRPETAKGATAQ
jgi:Flp pilus assembly protein TadD